MWRAQDVVAYRVGAQQLNRPLAQRPVTDAAILDLGVQDTGRDGASWALANRGVPLSRPRDLNQAEELALVWTLRASPHFYRRADLVDVLTATSPFSEADAGKRILGADQPLKGAGIGTRDGLAEVAEAMGRLVTEPMVKGVVSARLTAVLPPRHLRSCVPCGATHPWENPFRLAALYAGVELEPDTSPPVLKPISGWPRRAAGPAPDPLAAPRRLQVIRAYLRFLGPATPQHVAGFLDASVADIRAHWPEDAVEMHVEGAVAWLVEEPEEPQVSEELVRLLGPYDLLLQGRDRELLVPDASHRKALWPVLGRPGAVLSGAEVIGLWRPKAAGKKLTVRLVTWSPLAGLLRERVEEQAEALARHRGLTLAGVVEE